jgi:hypothetical protein
MEQPEKVVGKNPPCVQDSSAADDTGSRNIESPSRLNILHASGVELQNFETRLRMLLINAIVQHGSAD